MGRECAPEQDTGYLDKNKAPIRPGNLTTDHVCAQLPPSTTDEAGREITMQERGYPARRMVTSGRTRGWALWLCIVLVHGQMHQRAAGESSTPCVKQSDCRPGEFCGITVSADSFEGWLYTASYCFPCSECKCNGNSASGFCPADR